MRIIIKDCLKIFLKPKSVFEDVLASSESFTNTKILLFIAFMQLYILLLPSTLIFLLILVIPFALIIIGTLYFLSQELIILYNDAKQKSITDFPLYGFAYLISLLSLPSAILNLAINIFFIVKTNNFVAGSVFAFLLSFIPLLLYFFYINSFITFISNGHYGLLKFIELYFLSFISTLKAKLGYEVIKDLREDLENNTSSF